MFETTLLKNNLYERRILFDCLFDTGINESPAVLNPRGRQTEVPGEAQEINYEGLS